jgi:hypothetical protein
MTHSKVLLKSDRLCLSKPEIRFGNYFFQWDKAVKFGLSYDEINSFRNFVKNVIPLLEQFMMLLQNESKSSQGNSYHEKKKLFLEGKHNNLISFLLFVDIEGKATFYRQEKCDLIGADDDDNLDSKEDDNKQSLLVAEQLATDSDKSSKQNKYCSIAIKWLLGELLFDRTKKPK